MLFTLRRIGVSLLTVVCLLASNLAVAQCLDDNVFWFNGQTPPCGSNGSITIGGGTFATFQVDAGMTYSFSTCNSPGTYNTMLTGYDNFGNQLFFNDDGGPGCLSNKASVDWTANFTGTIKVHVDSFFCTTYARVSAVLEYRQSATITSSGTPMCAGETRTLTGTPAGGTFTGTGVVGNTFTAPNSNGTIPITYVFGSCSVVQNIQINQNPIVSIVSLDGNSFCTGDSARLTANVTSGSGSVTNYVWKRGGSVVGGNSANYSATQPGSYTLETTNSNGCVTGSAAFILSELTPPVVSFTGLAPDYCINDASTTLTGTPPGGTFSGAGSGSSNFVPFLAGVGTHNVTYSYTAPNGCVGSQTRTTIVTNVPALTFTVNPNSFCVNASPVTLTANPSGGTFSGVGVSGNTFNPTTAGVGGPYVITYTFTDTIGCGNTSSTTQSVNVTNLPVVTISGLAPEYCLNAPPASLNGSPSGGTFSGDGVTGDSFHPASADTGSHQVEYLYVDNNGCSGQQTASTFVNPLPVVSLTGLDAVYCEDELPVQMTGTPSGGIYGGVGLIANAFNPAGAGAGGPYTITYSYTDNNGCTRADTLQTSVNAIPTVTIGGLDPLYCAYIPDVPLTLTPAGGQLLGTGTSGSSFNPNQAGVGMHVLIYSYSDNAGCANSTQEVVTVDACVGIQAVNNAALTIYPNPTTGKIIIELADVARNARIRLYNMQGQQLLEQQANAGLNEMNLSEFAKGVYLLRFISENQSGVKKVILE